MDMSAHPVELSNRISSQLKKELTTKIVEFCAKDVRPMEIISGKGFIMLAQHFITLGATNGNFDVRSILPHPTTVSRHIVDVKNEWHTKLFPIIKNAIENEECSSTSDMWTEKYKTNPFLAMTVHFFDENFLLKKHVLFTSKYTQKDKSGDNILKELTEQFEKLGFKKEYLTKIRFVTDHGGNMVKALNPYMRDDCRAHRLNTILANTFYSDDVPLVILKILRCCKNIVRHLRQSESANKLAKALVQECKTRWNTKLGMVESITSQYEQVMELLTENQYKKWCFDLPLELIRFLTPFKEATKSLEGDTYPTASKVLLWWDYLSRHLNEENFSSMPMKSVVRIARGFFVLKYPIDMNNKIACFLDPRYRFLKMLTSIERDEVYGEVKRLLMESQQPQLEKLDNLQEPPPKKIRLSIFEESFEDSDNIDELELYMQNANYSDYLKTENNKKHLVELFWRNNQYRFPKLFQLAKRRLHVPASSGSSERVFTDGGRVYDKRRTNTKPELLDHLLYLNANIAL